MLRPLMANMEMLQWNTLEEAGISLGASPLFLATKVLIPNLLPGLLSGAVMTLCHVPSVNFSLAVMVTGSSSQTYPVVLYQAFYVSTGFACAATDPARAFQSAEPRREYSSSAISSVSGGSSLALES